MDVDADQIQQARLERGWSQADLAAAAGLDVRTIQRIESTGSASLRSKRVLAAALEVDVQDLGVEEPAVSPCPHCRSEAVYTSNKAIDTSTIGGDLVPKLGAGPFSAARVRAVVCGDCGLLRYFVDPGALAQLETSRHWSRA